MSDSGGLFLHISPKNHNSWRFKYRMEGKEPLLTLGVYPDVSLAQARAGAPGLCVQESVR